MTLFPEIHYWTVYTGTGRFHSGAEADPATIEGLRAVVFDAVGGPDWTAGPIPRRSGYTIEGCRVDRYASLWHVLGAAGKPLTGWAVATQPEASAVAWATGAALWWPGRPIPEDLAAPWVVVTLRGAIVFDPTAADWMPDLQRATAWTAWALGV